MTFLYLDIETDNSQGFGAHTKVLHDSKLKSKEFAECINTLLESETIEAVREDGSRKVTYILRDMGAKLETLKNPQSPQNLQDLLVSESMVGKEILETLKKFTQINVTHVVDPISDANYHSKKLKSLQNLSHSQPLGDTVTKEILGTKEIFESQSLVVTPEEAAALATEGGL